MHMLCLGHGYVARALTPDLIARGFTVSGTARRAEDLEKIAESGATPLLWDDVEAALASATHLLVSAAPEGANDPVLTRFGDALATAPLEWVGYLSATSVYGDQGGAWVDETAPTAPESRRGKARVATEAAWQASGLPVQIFRLAGIYGPGRTGAERILDGTAQRVIKPGLFFSRIHVEDIAQVLLASITRPRPGAVYNVADQEPAPPQDRITYAANLLGAPLPPEIPFEKAEMSAAARAFYADSKKIRADLIREELGVTLRYPTYREGLRALLTPT